MSDRIVRQFHARGALFATAVALVVTIALVGQTVPASATTPAVTVTAAPSTTTPGSKLDLTAAMPVSAAGTISQEIVMQIDPTKVKLTSSEDITAPAGWTVSYCSTTCTSPPTNFSTTKPTNRDPKCRSTAISSADNWSLCTGTCSLGVDLHWDGFVAVAVIETTDEFLVSYGRSGIVL